MKTNFEDLRLSGWERCVEGIHRMDSSYWGLWKIVYLVRKPSSQEWCRVMSKIVACFSKSAYSPETLVRKTLLKAYQRLAAHSLRHSLRHSVQHSVRLRCGWGKINRSDVCAPFDWFSLIHHSPLIRSSSKRKPVKLTSLIRCHITLF